MAQSTHFGGESFQANDCTGTGNLKLKENIRKLEPSIKELSVRTVHLL